jgi:hypothetical protein
MFDKNSNNSQIKTDYVQKSLDRCEKDIPYKNKVAAIGYGAFGAFLMIAGTIEYGFDNFKQPEQPIKTEIMHTDSIDARVNSEATFREKGK